MIEEQQAQAAGTAEAVRRNAITMSLPESADNLSKSKQKDIERALLAEARRKYAEKYGDEYKDE
jgi:hypothetical protein